MEREELQKKLKAAEKTIDVLMNKVEEAINATDSLHNLFEQNIQLKQEITEHLHNQKELQQFSLSLEKLVNQRTMELQEANKQLNQHNAHLKELIRKDGLTGLLNHSAMIELIEQRIAEARRYQLNLSIVIFDIDFFKKVNDVYGHQFGDYVLERLANALRESIRAVDYASRFGGEEFVILLTNTEKREANRMAERLRQLISELKWKEEDLQITISGGVAHFTKKDTSKTILARADKRLYIAKKNGRNRMVVSEDD